MSFLYPDVGSLEAHEYEGKIFLMEVTRVEIFPEYAEYIGSEVTLEKRTWVGKQ